MKCLKCDKQEYCSGLCKSHFIHYFERKFNKNLQKNKIIQKNENINILGENKELVRLLLKDFIKKYNIKISNKGRKIYTYSLNTEVINQLSYLFKNTKLTKKNNILSIFLDKEINKYSKLKKITIKKPKLTNFKNILLNKLSKLSKRKTNLWQGSNIFLKKLLK